MSEINPDATDPGMMPIRITDAASMLRRPINPNERPYTQAVYLKNNKLVDEWYEQVLQKIADKKCEIRAGQVWGEWQFFYHGKILPQFMKAFEDGKVCRPDSVAVEYWVDTFTKKSIEELAEMGPALVGHGWKRVCDESFIRGSVAKWEKVYSLTNDPLKWRKLAHETPSLWNAENDSPFWGREEIQDVTQKVVTVLKTTITQSAQ